MILFFKSLLMHHSQDYGLLRSKLGFFQNHAKVIYILSGQRFSISLGIVEQRSQTVFLTIPAPVDAVMYNAFQEAGHSQLRCHCFTR